MTSASPPPAGRPVSHRAVRVDEKLEAIIGLACSELGVEFQDFCGRGREPRFVTARRFVAVLGRRYTAASYPVIARRTGRATHSTIMAQEQRLAQELAERPSRLVGDRNLRDLHDHLDHKAAWMVSEIECGGWRRGGGR